VQSLIAQGALIIWPVVALVLFMVLPAGRAVIWTILAGYLLLPVGISFDLPGVPAMDKSSIPNLVAIILAPLFARSGEFRWPRSPVVKLLMLIWVLVPIGTMLNNGEPLIVGMSVRPGLGWWDALSMAIGNALELVPFLLGAALLAHEQGHRDIVKAVVLAALAYSLPVLAEIRLSPILQTWIYGVGSVEFFLQQIRGSGFRAMVFLGHGLLISTFLAMAVLGALGLWKAGVKLVGMSAVLLAVYLAIVLLLNKTMGAILLVLVLVPALLFIRQRTLLASIFLIGAVVATYPLARGTNLLPLQSIINAAGQISPARAESFEFRVRNETLLLNRAAEKPVFGWGSYGRNRVIVEQGWGEGFTDLTVTDGTWIIVAGTFGWAGYISCFGLLCYPFLRGFRLRRGALPVITLALLTMHLLNVLDLIPNSSLRPLTWLIAGALANMTRLSMREGRYDGARTSCSRNDPPRERGAGDPLALGFSTDRRYNPARGNPLGLTEALSQPQRADLEGGKTGRSLLFETRIGGSLHLRFAVVQTSVYAFPIASFTRVSNAKF